ncbi:hypothetical protein SCB49_00792 [unidentified eubacterium SCB49]|nr:hypothetical protein SCB49_00792 [unidentified eubacterium SCB49]
MKNLIVILSLVLFIQCQPTPEKLTAQQIVDKAITTACNGLCDAAKISFNFRGKVYKSSRKNGAYSLTRVSVDSFNIIKDEVTNNGLKRTINNTVVKVPDSLIIPISDGVNSVHYFAQLPYGLNDAAVKKQLVGEGVVKNEPYYKVAVSFTEEGGGTDFDDAFMYWIHKENFTVDYLAYSYATNGGGIRFREAYNARMVGNIRFVDYNNYKPATLDIPLKDLDSLFEDGTLSLLSKIELEKIAVN